MERGGLSEHVLRILTALATGPLHGYAIQQHVETAGFALGTSTLYTALKRLRREGEIVEVPGEPSDQGPRRRYYRLTDAGWTRLVSERERLRRLLELDLPPAPPSWASGES